VEDAEDDTIVYSLDLAPSGMTVNADTGLVSWTPADIGSFDVSLKADDGDLSAVQDFTIVVSPPNEAPRITSTPQDTAIVGIYYTYQLTAVDDDGDEMTADLLAGPSGMTLDADWLVAYLPDAGDVGEHTVTLQVSDGKVNVTQSYTLTVTSDGLNNVPYFVSKPVATVTVGHTYSYQLAALDDDYGDRLVFSLDLAPSGMFLGGNGDLIEWVPSEAQVGVNDVIARVSDGKAFSLQNFTVQVTRDGLNHPPVITSTPPATAKIGYTYEYQVTAVDDDLDILEYSMDTPMKRLSIHSASGLLTWHPASDALGNQTLTVRVSDGKGFDTQTFVVFVEEGEKNGLPIFLSSPPTTAKEGVNYTYPPQVQDPDMDPVTFTLAEKPDGMNVVLTTGVITWTPADGQAGNATVELRASDGKGFSFQRFTIVVEPGDKVQEFTLDITNPKDGQKVSGEISVEGTATVKIGEVYEVQVRVDSSMWKTANGTGSWNYLINTSKLNNGDHTISVRVWDGDTYSTPETLKVEVENKEEKPEDKPFEILGFDGTLCILIGVILLVVVFAIIMLTRKTGAEGPPPGADRRRSEEDERYDRDRRRDRDDDRDRPRRPRPREREPEYEEEGYEDDYEEDRYDDDYGEEPYDDDYDREYDDY
jgi:hypothetical protein